MGEEVVSRHTCERCKIVVTMPFIRNGYLPPGWVRVVAENNERTYKPICLCPHCYYEFIESLQEYKDKEKGVK